MKLTAHIHSVLRLRMNGDTLIFLHVSSQCGQGKTTVL